MDSSQKRERNRRKLQRRKDKETRRKQRAEFRHQQQSGAEPAPVSPGDVRPLTDDEPAPEAGPQEPVP